MNVCGLSNSTGTTPMRASMPSPENFDICFHSPVP
jgi:hypothetical protein